MIAFAHQSNIIPFPVCELEKPTQKSNEWYTPSRYIEAARRVMGSIDLDPASCALANETVHATRYYTKEENGLAQEWYGNVWLNPPYGLISEQTYGARFHGGGAFPDEKSLQVMFINKAIEEYKQGTVKQVMLLVTANTTVRWFQPLWEYLICTPYPKIGFIIPGSKARQRQVFGNVFVYLGPNESAFIREFSAFGTIAKAIAGPRREIVQASLWNAVQSTGGQA